MKPSSWWAASEWAVSNDQKRDLGRPPDDLLDYLVDLAIAGPAKATRHAVPSPGSMVAVRWLMRTITPPTVLKSLSSKDTF